MSTCNGDGLIDLEFVLIACFEIFFLYLVVGLLIPRNCWIVPKLGLHNLSLCLTNFIICGQQIKIFLEQSIFGLHNRQNRVLCVSKMARCNPSKKNNTAGEGLYIHKLKNG